MEQLSITALKANLEYSRNRLKQHAEVADTLQKMVVRDEDALKAALPNEVRDRFQAVFDEENFLDAIWFLQDEPQIKTAACTFLYHKKVLERQLTQLGVKFQ